MYQMIELQRGELVLRGYLYLPDCIDEAACSDETAISSSPAAAPKASASAVPDVPLWILMHGLLDSTRMEAIGALTDSLADAGMAVLAMDFDGHGASDGKFTDMTISKELLDAEAILAYAKTISHISEIHLVGHSLGGAVASMLAAAHPDDIHALYLLAPAGMVPENIADGFLLDAEFDPKNLPETITVFGEDTMTRSFLKDALTMNIFEKASAYPGPVHLIRGTADDLVPDSAMQSYIAAYNKAGNTDVSYTLIPDADHEYHGYTEELCRVIAALI